MALKYEAYLFDFDGTVADTGEGIRRSVAYSLEKLGIAVPGDEVLNRFIGPSLHDSYKEIFGMTDAEAEHAISVYRERYVDIGLYESRLYPGMEALLQSLHGAGAYVAIASSKPQFMLERLTARMGVAGYLNDIVGIGLEYHSSDKRDLIQRALPSGMRPERACMIGDRRFDIEAAKALGLIAIGADYGYSLPGELALAGADAVFGSVEDMAAVLLGEEAIAGL